MFGGIVQGQIVDAFSELRDDANANEDDLNSNCLICSVPSTTLEREAPFGFVDHRDVTPLDTPLAARYSTRYSE